MKGYKAFDKDLKCRGMQYEVGKTYEMSEKPIYCKRGYHFCKNIAAVYKYYPMSDETRICEVVSLGEVVTDDNEKYCTNKIKIVREIKSKAVKHCNTDKSDTGYRNSGDCNSGDCNSGDRNSGDCNSGDCNSGDRNSGDCNSGYHNSGYYNSGDCNSGYRNSGDCNSGYCNSGDCNSGYRNSGDCNSGDCNSGDCNSGDCNSGYRNSGDCNSGDCNSGYCNSGDCNSGDCNSGDCNSGDYNYGNYNSGVFNVDGNPKIKMFDKESDWRMSDWQKSDVKRILKACPSTYSTYICASDMSDEEKEYHPAYKTLGGYVKTIVVSEEDKQAWWDSLPVSDKQKCYNLPNFNAVKFVKCLGIKHL